MSKEAQKNAARHGITLAQLKEELETSNNTLRKELYKELKKTRAAILKHMDERFNRHEEYFTEMQGEIQKLQEDMTDVKQEIKDFRAETNSFHKGFGAKSGRQDVFNYRLVGALEAKTVLNKNQAGEFRAL